MNFTVFTTYALIATGYTQGLGCRPAIHCNYIKSVEIDTLNLDIHEISLNFSNPNEFKFLNNGVGITGYTGHRIYMLVQIGITTSDTKPKADKWKIYDVTNQINGYTGILTPSGLTNVVFKAPLNLYAGKNNYNLQYLNYPSFSQTNELVFGEEQYFFGNVTADIKADVYTTDLSINLPSNQFNSSNNLTWNGDKVYVTEIGLYDSNKNLVAIAKLNDPVPKNSSISRTIVFAIDF